MRDLRFLFLDLNSFFASVAQQEMPYLRGKPTIIVPLESDYTCAIAASYEAKAFGIKTGTMVHEAKRLCPGLEIVPAQHELYVQYHQRILYAVEQVLPIHSVASIDEFACALMGDEQEEARAIALAKKIKAEIAARVGTYVRCSIGLAPNRFLAKIATDLHKPDGLTVLHTDEVFAKLKHLVPQDIPGIGYQMSKRLARHGVFTFEALWQLAPKQMRAIWHSVAGEQMYYKLRGLEIPDTPTHKSTVGHSHVLAPQWRPAPLAYTVAQRLCMKAGSRLRRMQYRARFVDLGVRIQDGPKLYYRAQMEAACDNHQLMHALAGLWQQMLADTGSPTIKKIAVTLHGLEDAASEQPSLFDDDAARHARTKRETLSHAMDRLNARFGRDTVLLGSLPKRTGFTGTKIAFSRVPQMAEFSE